MLFRFCLAVLSVFSIALPSSAWAEMQAATPTPQRHSFNVTYKFPPKAERRPIPFELVKGLLVFKARVSGQEVWAILDNGMGMTVIDKQFASDQNIVVGPVVAPLETTSGVLERRIALNLPLELPGQVSLTAPVAVVDLKFMAMATGRPIAMIVGREYFANLVFVVLPDRKTFELGPSGTLVIPATIPFATIGDDDARLEVDVGGRKLSLLVDLGANEQILLGPEAWTRLDLDKAPQSKGWSAKLDGKPYEVSRAEVPRVIVGPFFMDDVRVTKQPKISHDADGFIGLGFLANFNFAIDVKQRKLWMLGPVKRTLAPGETAP